MEFVGDTVHDLPQRFFHRSRRTNLGKVRRPLSVIPPIWVNLISSRPNCVRIRIRYLGNIYVRYLHRKLSHWADGLFPDLLRRHFTTTDEIADRPVLRPHRRHRDEVVLAHLPRVL